MLRVTVLSPYPNDGDLKNLTAAQISGDRIVGDMRQSGIAWALRESSNVAKER